MMVGRARFSIKGQDHARYYYFTNLLVTGSGDE
jgi:hypothetical protein